MDNFDSIIFDLDGTLWDASFASAAGWNIALIENNLSEFQVTDDDIRKISGLPFGECLANLFGHIEMKLSTHKLKILRVFPKILEVLNVYRIPFNVICLREQKLMINGEMKL